MLSPKTLELLAQVSAQTSVNIFLISGIKLHGIITEQAEDSFILVRDGVGQLVLHQAIATVIPSIPNN